MSINRVNISGNLTRDPELRSTANGTGVLTFGVAVNDRRRNPQTQEWEDVPNFIDCVLFGARAQALQRFLSKGSKVAVEGKLRYNSWERDGQRHSKIEVVVDEVELMSTRGQNTQAGYDSRPPRQDYSQPYTAAAPAPSQTAAAPIASAPIQQTPPPADVYDEDIPF